DPFSDQPQAIYENLPLASQILHRVRTSVSVPVVAKLGAFRTPRLLHDTVTRLASWARGFVLVHGFQRRVVDEDGNPVFEGAGRDRADIVGGDTFSAASRQVAELLAWRKAGCWDRAVLAVGGITTVERAHEVLRVAGKATTAGGLKVDFLNETVEGDTAAVETAVAARDGNALRLGFRLVRRAERWVVRDVVMDGVSTMENYHAQFQRLVRDGSWPELMAQLRAKVCTPAGTVQVAAAPPPMIWPAE